MNKIGVIGSTSFTNQTTIFNIFQSIKRKFGPYAVILSGGNDTGAEPIIKKFALELGFTYKEYNPSYTGHRMYSALPTQYYGKGYHQSHLTDRYKHLINDCDYLIIFIDKGSESSIDLKYAIQRAEKLNRKLVIIHK